MKLLSSLSILCLVFISLSCKQNHSDQTNKIAYCETEKEFGNIQSPINILSGKVEGAVASNLNINAHINAVENTGHSVQLDFDSTSQILFDNHAYDFNQLHFHTPSEHQIDGITYPMEMHMVNVLQDDKSPKPHYLVIGVLFKMGKRNAFIDEFINKIPRDHTGMVNVKDTEVNLEDLFGNYESEEMKHYYHYKGSLTTPPYTETVSWHINQVIFEASEEQIKILNQIEGNNARHIQALKGRHVEKEDLLVVTK